MDSTRLSALAGQLPDAIVVVGNDGRLAWGNAAAERMFGLSLAEVQDRSGFELIHPDDLSFVALALETVQEKVAGNPIEVRIRARDGWRLVELVGAPVGDDQIVLCLRDLTARRRFEVAHSEEARFRSLMHNARVVPMLVREDGTIESIPAAISRVTGHDPAELEGRPLASILATAEDRDRLGAALTRARAEHQATVVVDVGRRGGVGTVPLELSVVDLLDDPTVRGFVVSAHDATEQLTTERELRTALSLLEATLESTADGILVIASDGRITSYNHRFVELWRFPESLLRQTDDHEAMQFVRDQIADPDAFLARMAEITADAEAESHDTLQLADGRVFERFSRPQRVDGTIVGRVWCFRDRTEHKQLEDELVYRAFHDELTGLANKARFCERLQQSAHRSQRSGNGFAVLFLDLDNFKTVNDSLGHHAGDQLLISAAAILTDCLRPSDTPARLGGDEFAILVDDLCDLHDAMRLAERIRDAFRQPFRVARHDVSATVSIGIAFGTSESTSEEILRDADLAMYMAKSRGKNRFELFQAAQHDAAVVRVEVESELRQAIQRDELILFYQPMVDLASDRIIATEALVRWDHPDRGLLLPGAFVPLAEETGLMEQLGRQVMVRACNETRAIRRALGHPLRVSVNVSARQLVLAGFAGSVAEILEYTAFDPDGLILEITETAMIDDADAARESLAALRAMGVSIALDDFGTGYSSLTFLQQFPIDIVKIDKSFVSTLDDPFGPSLAPAVIEFAQRLGLTTVAEGVETEEQLTQLRALGCDLGQGFYLHRPYASDGLHRALTADSVTDAVA
jgi:diguanylate cyclase (GGDEF)-like protein/PAS domain S-box-containing protein